MRATEFIIEAANPKQQAAIAIAKKKKKKMSEGFMGNVKDTALKNIDPDNHNKGEGDFVKNQLHTIKRVVTHLENSIGSEEDLPDWVQSEIAKVTDKIVNVMDYSISKKEQDIGSDSLMKEQGVAEDWQKVNHHDKTDGMSGKAVKAYRRENPGSKLKTAVTTKPSKLKKGGKAASRRKSFCARMGGMKKHNAGAKTKRDPDSPINKALRRWNCESVEQLQELVMLAEQFVQKSKK